jgi:hypothetical protein
MANDIGARNGGMNMREKINHREERMQRGVSNQGREGGKMSF